MSQGVQQQLVDQIAYGCITRSQIPGDIQDYNVSLVKQVILIKNQEQTRLRLKFIPKRKNSPDMPFFINIDKVRTPANSLYLMKYQETEDGRIQANMSQKITRKMIMNVEKDRVLHQDIIVDEQQSNWSDSDIPRRMLFPRGISNDDSGDQLAQNSAQLGRPRKRKNIGYQQQENEND